MRSRQIANTALSLIALAFLVGLVSWLWNVAWLGGALFAWLTEGWLPW